jgi:hypothetical protein
MGLRRVVGLHNEGQGGEILYIRNQLDYSRRSIHRYKNPGNSFKETINIKLTIRQYSDNVTTVTSSEELFLYEERDDDALYCSYSFEWIKSGLKSPEKVMQAPQDCMRHYIFKAPFVRQGELWSPDNPMVSLLWDSRISVMRTATRGGSTKGEYMTLSILEEVARPGDTGKGWVIPHVARWIKEPGIGVSLDRFDIYDVGIFGKTAFWLENSPNMPFDHSKQTIEKLCFADFPSPKRLDASSMNQEASILHPETQNGSKENPDETFENTSDSLAQPPPSIGHTCEFPFFQKWLSDYNGVYSVEFDDSRGRLVTTTGNGKILIADFV